MADQSFPWNQDTSPTSPFNAMKYAIETAKNAMSTCTIVQVKKVTTTGEVAGVGRVDVQPLVQMVNGIQQTVDHVTVYNLPYLRMIGGTSAVILDPKVDDIGIVVIADRDVSGVKNSKKVSPPGSMRRYNLSDGFFLGSVLADAPTSYVQFHDDGTITLSPDNGNTLVQVKKDQIMLKHVPSEIAVYVTPSRIDLGMLHAPHAVVTVDGPSTKVFAVISESDS